METAKTIRDTTKTIKDPTLAQHKSNVEMMGKLVRAIAPPRFMDAISTVKPKQKPTFMQRASKQVPATLLGVPLLLTGLWALANIFYGVGWVALKLGLSFGSHGALILGSLVVLSIAVSIGVVIGFSFASYKVGRWTLDHPIRAVVEEVERLSSRWRDR
jgi:hypothetical protein